MLLKDLSISAQHILRTLYFSGAGMRRHELGEQTGLSLDQLSPHLTRMKAKGLLDNEITGGNGSLWTVTDAGNALFSEVAESTPEPEEPEKSAMEPIPDEPEPEEAEPEEAEAEPEPEPELEPVPTDAVAVQLLNAMEIEFEIDRLRHQLQLQLIPAQTARVYREIVAALPPVLREALAPLTEWLDAAP